MMEAAVDQPDAFVREYGLVGDEERRQIVEVFNRTKAELPEGMAVHQVFEEQAQRTPASTAVVYEGTELTYRELNALLTVWRESLSNKVFKRRHSRDNERPLGRNRCWHAGCVKSRRRLCAA